MMEVGTYLMSRGIAPAEVLRRNGLPASLLLDSDAWIEGTVCFDLVNDIARHTRDPFLGLHFAEVQRLQDYGPWAQGVLGASCLRDALEFAARHIGLIRTGLAIRPRTEGDRALLSTKFSGVTDSAARHPSLACMMTLYKIVRLVAKPLTIEVRLSLPRPRATDEAERLLGPNLTFGADRNELAFDRAALDLPLRPLTAQEQEVFGLFRIGQPLVTAREAYRQMVALLEEGQVTVADVASALNVGVRKLQRHLGRWGLTFESMLDEYRHNAALHHLTETRTAVTDIAFLLGYADSSHFSRAVRRWTGLSPRQLRGQQDLSRGWRSGLPHTRALPWSEASIGSNTHPQPRTGPSRTNPEYSLCEWNMACSCSPSCCWQPASRSAPEPTTIQAQTLAATESSPGSTAVPGRRCRPASTRLPESEFNWRYSRT
ncbi:MAG: AraC family transcriptional regulator ligand-binding domain-containing protein [Pseudomonadales bacterium]